MSGDPVRQGDEIGDRKLLGTTGEERMFGAAEIPESRPERIADHLAPLAEGGLHDTDEQRLVARETLRGIAAQADDGALDLRGAG